MLSAIPRRLRWIVGATVFSFAGLSAGVASAAEPAVVVTMKPVHSLVSQIMDGIAKPVLIVDGTASPHTFTLRPSAAKAINDAAVFVRVSESVEPFTRKIVKALPDSVALITLSEVQGMNLLEQREGGTFEEHVHEEDHDHGGKDGHIWLDPENAKSIVLEVTKVLSEKFPEQAVKLKSNADKLHEKLDALTVEIESLLAPVKGKPFVVFHDATQYFENRFAMKAAGSITVSPDVQPSAKRLTEVRKKIAQLDAVCVFAEPGFQPNLVAAVTEGSKARSGTIDAEGQTLTPSPELYFDLMRGLARNIRGCLQPVS